MVQLSIIFYARIHWFKYEQYKVNSKIKIIKISRHITSSLNSYSCIQFKSETKVDC